MQKKKIKGLKFERRQRRSKNTNVSKKGFVIIDSEGNAHYEKVHTSEVGKLNIVSNIGVKCSDVKHSDYSKQDFKIVLSETGRLRRAHVVKLLLKNYGIIVNKKKSGTNGTGPGNKNE